MNMHTTIVESVLEVIDEKIYLIFFFNLGDKFKLKSDINLQLLSFLGIAWDMKTSTDIVDTSKKYHEILKWERRTLKDVKEDKRRGS